MAQIQFFSEGKIKERNEDYFGYSSDCFVIADGATDKTGRKYNGKTGGEIISRLVVQEALSSALVGNDLVDFLNKRVYKLYQHIGIIDDIEDPKYRFSCGSIIVRMIGGKFVITYIGDLGFRINGNEVHKEMKQVDIDNAEERAKYIQRSGDIEGSRNHIMPLLLKQFEYQNNPHHLLGYGVIDGIHTPSKFVKIFEYPREKITMIELFSDGYFVFPLGTTIKDWESTFAEVEQKDPDKWQKYKSTKSQDDRSIVIIKF